MVETQSKSRSSSPENPLPDGSKKGTASVQKLFLSSGGSETEDKARSAVDKVNNEGDPSPVVTSPSAIRVYPINETKPRRNVTRAKPKTAAPSEKNDKVTKVVAKGKGKKPRELKADLLFDSEIHKAWPIPVRCG